MHAAILFQSDGYLLDGPKLMGRQVAGNGFLRAAVACRGDGPVTGVGPGVAAGETFKKAVADIDARAEARWIAERKLSDLAACRTFYRPDPVLGVSARRRLRAGVGAYSLCGVTHTLCTQGTLQAIADYLTEPVMPWDALICTSQAALTVVEETLDHQAELLRWRLGGASGSAPRPMLPVIPLGVHTADFDFTPADRDGARRGFSITEDEVAVLFAGRLSVSGKAHPYPMLQALEWAAAATGKRIVLILAGKPQNDVTGDGLEKLVAATAPGVRVVQVDGGDFAAYRRTWAAADIFISLADSIQETFGLTPLEAMAAGLPALVSDWNGYKETVRDGVDGFRIRTWAAPPEAGEQHAADYDLMGVAHYSTYLLAANMAVALDMDELRARLRELIENPDLRARMGAAGKARARAFEWTGVYRQYQALWAEQDARRLAEAADHAGAPRTVPAHRSPFATFAHYPTRLVTGRTLVAAAPSASEAAYRAMLGLPLMNLRYVAPVFVGRLLALLETGPICVDDIAKAFGLTAPATGEAIAQLAKLDQVTLSDPAD